MNVADASFRYRLVVTIASLVVVVGGWMAYEKLGRLEDPAFPIKQAVVAATYPGAAPQEVAEEVTDVLERHIQQMGQVDYLESVSSRGRTTVKVFIKDHHGGDELPQIWDELRRKVQAAEREFPPGAGPAAVNDDFGDVYGVLFYVYGEGFDLVELNEYAKTLRRELLLVQDVASVSVLGAPRETIFIEAPRARLAQLGTSLQQIIAAFEGRGLVVSAGNVLSGNRRLAIEPAGGLTTVDEIRQTQIVTAEERTVRLGDIARVERGLTEPPSVILRYNGHPAIALGVATVAGGNVVTMGQAVRTRLGELQAVTPIGVELGIVSMQSDSVRKAVNSFTISLAEAVAIVVGTLLLAMGLRSGLLIGFVLLLTVLGTFIAMQVLAIDLQRISLGALIIALGMLVDNAIVVVEGIQAGLARGLSGRDASKAIVGQTTWPLLGATLIATLAFAPIGLSPDSTGEYCRSLFDVIWISLLLSWIFAITATPVFGAAFLHAPRGGGQQDPYGGWAFRIFRRFLGTCLHHRWLTIAVMVILLVTGVVGFGKVQQGFFPASARPQFLIDYWRPEGTDIHAVEADLARLESWLLKQDHVTAVATCVGMGTLRFELTYAPEMPNAAYGQLLVSVDDHRQIDGLCEQVRRHLPEAHPDALAWPWRMLLGPGGEAKIQARLRGPDPERLRQLAAQIEDIMAAEPYATAIRNDWRQETLTLQPVLAEPQASRVGVTRREVSQALAATFEGLRVGLYRERDELIPIVLRAPVDERNAADQLRDVHVWSPRAQRAVPLTQVVSHIDPTWEDPLILRRNRLPTLTVKCDPAAGTGPALLNRLRPKIEALALPTGYSLEWGGEYEKAAKANRGLTALLPLCFGGMVLVLVILFNNLRQPLVILLTVPLAIIGVSIGMLLTGAEFGFMAILGVLSLSGMLIKNAIVLNDEINAQLAAGAAPYEAVVQSAVSRARPVVLAALTTVLGMIPLLTDVFFKDMAIAIMFGLSFATVLTLIVVPVLYSIVCGARPATERGAPV
jgi:multidrug efflux pump subunit AcrB